MCVRQGKARACKGDVKEGILTQEKEASGATVLGSALVPTYG